MTYEEVLCTNHLVPSTLVVGRPGGASLKTRVLIAPGVVAEVAALDCALCGRPASEGAQLCACCYGDACDGDPGELEEPRRPERDDGGAT